MKTQDLKDSTRTNTPALTGYDMQLLGRLRLFPQMDKGSQERLRREVDARRKQSPAFDEAFGGSLSGKIVPREKPAEKSIFHSLRDGVDALLHPVDAIKGKVAETLLKRRNKAPEILTYPDPRLLDIAEEWDFDDGDRNELLEIVRLLGAALREADHGDRLGMAAPQIGIQKRVFVCQGAVCVNPKFYPVNKGEMVEMLEGCYSAPGKQIYKTNRHKNGLARWYSIDGELREYKLKGLDAIVFQHELDHLDGKCICETGVL